MHVLAESAEWAGLWWLPDEPGAQVPGTLRYSPDTGLRLDLIGRFENKRVTKLSPGVIAYGEGHGWQVIQGVAQHRRITLFDCFARRGQVTWGARVASPDSQSIVASAAVVGAHVEDREACVFSAVTVSVDNLTQWAAESRQTVSRSAPDAEGRRATSVAIEPTDDHVVSVGDVEYRLTHRPSVTAAIRRRGGVSASAQDQAVITASPSAAVSLDAALRTAVLVQDLVSLATNSAAGIISVGLDLAPSGAGPAGSRGMAGTCALFQPAAVGDPDTRAIDGPEMLFSCATVPFEELMPAWCHLDERVHPAIAMVLGLRYLSDQYVETQLLVAAGAAEALHQALPHTNSPVPQEAFASIREAALAQVPEAYQGWFKSKIRNTPTLRDRLVDLAAHADPEATGMLIPDAAEWARVTVRARNDLAHTGRSVAVSFEQLVAATEATRALVLLDLLQELNVPGEEQRRVVRDNGWFRYAARQADEHLRAAPPA